MQKPYTDYRENARRSFAANGLSYADIKEKDFYMLLAILADELAIYSELKKDPLVHGISTMRISNPKNALKRFLPIFNRKNNGELESAFIKVNSHYFEGREAISFNKDGFIGFAGWADDTNIQPFTNAFKRFCNYLLRVKNGLKTNV